MTEEELIRNMGNIIYKHQGGFVAINPIPIPIHTKEYCMGIARELVVLIREAGWRKKPIIDIKLSDDLKYWRAERPDEWTMDRFIKKAEELEEDPK